ncbi:RNA-dependent RNA polymerase [Botrytis cinerea fusarivirus 7]|uniref:RNA-dependent RNA polymerase n=1 Tax=Botrytis cinerea fusarivirus 7 TaxID=2735923 RepID=A0AAE7AK31_9VIRU|nr:RNA-dependent RNA polymerase [Botrytis cinerea fusarivirus 7]QJT73723.1 RNA-dependent RNA polymerase [Botrytis cinerea fusarivirus 7]
MDSFWTEIWKIFRSRSDHFLLKRSLECGLIKIPTGTDVHYDDRGIHIGWTKDLEHQLYSRHKMFKLGMYAISYFILLLGLMLILCLSCVSAFVTFLIVASLITAFILHPIIYMGFVFIAFALFIINIAAFGRVMHPVILDTFMLLRGRNHHVPGSAHNFVSASIMKYFVYADEKCKEIDVKIDNEDKKARYGFKANGLYTEAYFHMPEYQEFDSHLSKLYVKYLDWYEKGLWEKLACILLMVIGFKLANFVIRSTAKVAEKFLYMLTLISMIVISGTLTPMTIFAIYFWIIRFIRKVLKVATQFKDFMLRVSLNSFRILASSSPSLDFEKGSTIVFTLDGSITLKSFLRLKFKTMRLRFLTRLLVFMLKTQMIIDRKTATEKKIKFRSVFTSFSLEVTRKVNEVNVPGFIRKFPSYVNRLDVQSTIDILKDLGYPVGGSKVETPNLNVASGQYNDWIQSGTNFITGLHALKTYDFVEFNKFKRDVQEYRRSDSYVNIHNELESVSRYFNNKTVSIPKEEKVVDEVWELVKTIYEDSRITPIRSIYKKWKKNYNVGPFAPSAKTRKDGGLKKMRRTEDIARHKNLTSYLNYWTRLYQNFPALSMISSAFYKSEALPEKKWKKDKVRTPIGSMLPQYLWQMVWSYEPNHRFKPNETPVQIGLPLTGFHLSKLFERHSKMNLHYAGDCSEFDSTITKNVQNIIKSVRKKGFSRHRQFDMICEMIDINYDRLNESMIITPTTGNVYRKGTGLTTGHASTSSDNSLALVSLYMAAWVNLTGLSAHEFKNFNELSCYGDDNLFSIAEGAPKVWTFDNIRNILKDWGVTMNNEVPDVDPHDLTKLPFLSKFCRLSTVVEQAYFKEKLNMNAPKYVVYHNPDALMGKMRAPVLNRDPRYKITRVMSYLELCAHNEKAYYVGREVIEILLKKYPDLQYMRSRLYSYDQVMERFYSSSTSVRDPDERDFEDFDPNEIVEYGSMTMLDYVFNYLSVVPDVLNPSIKNVGFGRTAQRALGPLMTWPKELLIKSNRVYSEGHLTALMKSSCYDFIEDRSLTSSTLTTTSLLVRHWLFLYFKIDSEKYNPLAWFDWMLMKLAALQFIINGKVQTKYKNYSFPVWNLLLVGLLNIIVVPDIQFVMSSENIDVSLGQSIVNFSIPDLSYWIGKIYNLFVNMIWDQVPPNFKNLQYLERPEHHGKTHLVIAGTGTGKSTTMILYLQNAIGPLFKKIIVIEPRSKVVKGLVQYTKTIGVEASGLTSGMKLDEREKVWYMTAQELILNPQWLNKENLFVLDECHIDELPYQVVKSMLTNTPGLTVIFATATPDQKEKDLSFTTTAIELPKIYNTETKSYNMDKPIKVGPLTWRNKYLGIVSEIMSQYRTPEKFLIFVNDKSDLEIFSKIIKGKGIFLSSETEEVDLSDDCDFVVTTAVCDVAITIPGVTVVITPNFVRSVNYESDGSTKPIFTRIPPSTLRQRMGRTGRTNNGDAFVINFEGDFILDKITTTNEGLITDWLASGLDINILGKYMPRVFNCFETNLTAPQISLVSTFIETNRIDKFKKSQRLKNPDEIPPREMNLFGIHMEGISGTSSGFEFTYSDLVHDYIQVLKSTKEYVAKTNWAADNINLSKARFMRDNFLSSIANGQKLDPQAGPKGEVYGTKRQFFLPETKRADKDGQGPKRPVRKGSF